MPWKTINGNRYYYRKRRVDGRETWHYVGPEIIGKLAERQDWRDSDKAFEAAYLEQRQRKLAEHLDRRIAEWAKLVGTMAAAILKASGFHRPNRGRWRRKSMATEAKAIQATDGDWIGREGVAKFYDEMLAKPIDPPTIRRVRDLILAAPTDADIRFVADKFGGKLSTVAGNLLAERHSRAGFVGMAAAAATTGKVGPMASQLAGADPPLEVRLLADRAALLWARVYLEEIALDEVARKAGDREIAARERRIERLGRQFNAALKTLAQVKRLLRPRGPAVAVQVNNVVNVGGEAKAATLAVGAG